ncbi:acyl-CoA dehydrogenase family protein [Oceanibacterium hippocampi]|uniref:acyl-CoA dehydrogenase family protein n=1 Tax=Oceanibacterium hippocampi TaxID=745714 RepID=UPI001C3820E5|nr:acyl-CoA dehydrogenase family protein [Oceanibacterium hippocampi]
MDENQKLIEQSLRGFLSRTVTLDKIRQVVADRGGFDGALWDGVLALGLPGLMVPEEFGGAGLGVFEAALVAEALGHAAAPIPFVATNVVAPLAISLMGTAEQQGAFLPAVAAGEARVALAAGALSGATGTTDLHLVGGRLSGRASGVIDSGGASHVLVLLADGRAVIVAVDDEGVELLPWPSLDRTRPLGTLVLSDAPGELLDANPDVMGAALGLVDTARLMLAADTLGAAQRMIEKSVEYASQRVQFERVIASFQAVKHMCAEMAASLEPCRSLIWYAAHVQDTGSADERRTMACLAKAHLSEVGRDVARTATEVHGGMGFTDLMGLHFWFKRIGYDRQVLGGPERCRQEAVEVQDWLAA